MAKVYIYTTLHRYIPQSFKSGDKCVEAEVSPAELEFMEKINQDYTWMQARLHYLYHGKRFRDCDPGVAIESRTE